MLRHRYFGPVAFALASTMLLAACSSDTPTSPPTASQSLTETAPTIALSSTKLFFDYPAVCSQYDGRCLMHYGRYAYKYRSVYITNTGGGTLNWTSTKSATWIKRSPKSGTAPYTMRVWVDGTGLPQGTYYGRLKVWATGATNSPQTVDIAMYRH
jgi:hypothetical protein